MKYALTIVTLVMACLSYGQDLPRKSPATSLTQIIGLNEITLNYSRPSVNGRTIFGGHLAYGEVWRLGANECTRISLDFPIVINGQKLDAGQYSMFAIPKKNQWTIVFNTDREQWGSNDYDASKNVLETTVPVSIGGHTESMSIGFESLMESSANLVIRWDDVTVAIPFTTDTKGAVTKGIQEAIEEGEDLAKVYANSAEYMYEAGDTTLADGYLKKSLSIERSYFNVFLSAQITADTDVEAAKKLAIEAISLAEKAEKAGWVRYMNRKMGEWM